MRQYYELIKDIYENGKDVEDRTGVGTRSVFGRQMRFDLTEGFPLLTLKKTFMKGITHELLWFLAGDTNIKYLQDNNVRIWDSWTDKYGSIGKGYGHQWRNWSEVSFISPRKSSYPAENLPNPGGICDIAQSVSKEQREKGQEYFNTWSEMIHRCYNSKRDHYKYYGAKGVKVCDRWLNFDNFLEDIVKIEGYNLRRFDKTYTLDKDFYGSNVYAPDTVKWSSVKEQRLNTSRSNIIKVTFPDGYSSYEYDMTSFCKMYLLDYSQVRRCVRGDISNHKGFKFEKVENNSEYLIRFKHIDQIKTLVNQLKNNPNSRRAILSSWNVGQIDEMQLPPCHCFFQFKVYGDELSCQLYQRSADTFLGVPFNIASYALLTHMVAQVTGLKAKEFIHTFGDAHIYSNHFSQTEELLSRDPDKYALPKLYLNPDVNNIFDFKYEDIKIVGYDSYPAIKAEVAV